jgi:nitrogen fixation protein NifU and related proteins
MDLESLYQEIILDHYKHPRGKGRLAHAEAEAFHVNPTCGDEITVEVSRSGEGVLIGYEGQGCSISQASASVMYELLNEHSPADIALAQEAFLDLMHSKGAGEPDEDRLGDGVAFVGVSKYPARIKCALLPWMALQDAYQQMEGSHGHNG